MTPHVQSIQAVGSALSRFWTKTSAKLWHFWLCCAPRLISSSLEAYLGFQELWLRQRRLWTVYGNTHPLRRLYGGIQHHPTFRHTNNTNMHYNDYEMTNIGWNFFRWLVSKVFHLSFKFEILIYTGFLYSITELKCPGLYSPLWKLTRRGPRLQTHCRLSCRSTDVATPSWSWHWSWHCHRYWWCSFPGTITKLCSEDAWHYIGSIHMVGTWSWYQIAQSS